MTADVILKRAACPEERAAAYAIRHAVFVREQAIPTALDRDGRDDAAVHVLAYVGGEPAGTARLVVGEGGAGVVARVAVLPAYRGWGLGRRLVRALEDEAAGWGVRRLVLHPHEHLEGYYRDLGYRRIGGTHTAGSHRLLTMEKRLP